MFPVAPPPHKAFPSAIYAFAKSKCSQPCSGFFKKRDKKPAALEAPAGLAEVSALAVSATNEGIMSWCQSSSGSGQISSLHSSAYFIVRTRSASSMEKKAQ